MCLCFRPDEAEVGFCLFACVVFPLLEAKQKSRRLATQRWRYALLRPTQKMFYVEKEKCKQMRKEGVNFIQMQQLTDSFHLNKGSEL